MNLLGGLLLFFGLAGWAWTATRPSARARTQADWVESYWVVVFQAPPDLAQWQVWTSDDAWKRRDLDDMLAQATTWSSERAWDDAGDYIREKLV